MSSQLPGTPPTLSLLLVGDQQTALARTLRAAGFVVSEAIEAQGAEQHDAVLWPVKTLEALGALVKRAELPQVAFDSALVVILTQPDAALEADLFSLGAEAVLPMSEMSTLERTLRHAVMRKRVERAARTAYATDLATGLPHQAQLLEHMTQLLALREREPAPMVLLVLRIEGYASAAARLGGESGNILRRKVAVRLRSGLRASDVVAAMGNDTFGVLLGRLESRGDGERVAAKLARALQQPFMVAGQACAVGAAIGMALYPEHGKDARSLMQRATAQAGSVATLGQDGQQGLAGRIERSGSGAAANDEA
jgi:diguanylate cyclase (GGDEF)-like protein